tara:strand:+ start:184 stop:1221 length:1038 start_codon:yes stop_codon:yes gene_type:complete
MSNLSIIIALKNRTEIIVDYEPISIRCLERNKIITADLKKKIDYVDNDKKKIKLKLLQNCVKSLSNVKKKKDIFEVILVDFLSDDYNLESLVDQYKNLDIKIIKVNDNFSRGKGLNIGIKNAKYSNLFLCDADMYFTGRDIFENAYKELSNNKVFFPICFTLIEPTHQIGYWREKGYGLSFVTKKDLGDYELSEYNTFGKEDNDIWGFFNEKNKCARYRVKNYYHQWHPDSKTFKNKNYALSDYSRVKIYTNVHENKFLEKMKEKFNKYYIVNNLELNVNYAIILYSESVLNKLYEFKNNYLKSRDFKIYILNCSNINIVQNISNYSLSFRKDIHVVESVDKIDI